MAQYEFKGLVKLDFDVGPILTKKGTRREIAQRSLTSSVT